MKKIAVLIGKDFEDSEYTQPAEAFKRAGYQIVHLGLNKGDTVTGKKQNTPVKIDIEVNEANPAGIRRFVNTGRLLPGQSEGTRGTRQVRQGDSWIAASRFLPYAMDPSF